MANFKSKSLGQQGVAVMVLATVNLNFHSRLHVPDPKRLE